MNAPYLHIHPASVGFMMKARTAYPEAGATAPPVRKPDETTVDPPLSDPDTPDVPVSSLEHALLGTLVKMTNMVGPTKGRTAAFTDVIPPKGFDNVVALATMSDGTAPAVIRNPVMSRVDDERRLGFVTWVRGYPLTRTRVSESRAESCRMEALVFCAVLACWKNTSPPTISANAIEM